MTMVSTQATAKPEDNASAAVPLGYKRTGVGVIPEDWEIKSLSDLCPPQCLVRGPFGGALKKESFVDSGFKVYEQRNAIYKSCEIGSYFINQHKFTEMQRFSVKPGDFIISCSGTIGRIYQIPTNAPPGVINQALLKIRTDEQTVLDRFFYLVFEWEQFQARIIDSTQGGAMQNLVGMDVFKKTPIALPTLPEQRAIASALSDVDNLLTALDQLIAKKRAIKQAAMQQLLSGKTRLPGFSGEWAKYTLGDLGPFSKGRGIKRDDVTDDGVGCIRYGELYTTYHNYFKTPISHISKETAKTSLPITTGDLLFAGSGETAEEIGRCAAYLGKEEIYAGGDIIVFRPKDQNSLYLGHLMNHSTVAIQKFRLGQGDAVVHISSRNLAQIEIDLPEVEEQDAIAEVFFDMDTEINTLEHRRDKTKAIKQGMMQELLSGRIRLL